MEPGKYTLPDAPLISGTPDGDRHLVWRPDSVSIILGRSNEAGASLHLDRVADDEVPVFKRPSGGETVLLSPRTLVISAIKTRQGIGHALKYFRFFNDLVIRSLESLGVEDLQQRGISDISIRDQKILGSAIYQNKDNVFYHAVLNVAETPALISRYIKHPGKEPDYRRGRSHGDFVTSLEEKGYDLDFVNIKQALEKELTNSRAKDPVTGTF